ncbi:hypothetical protein C8Q74DRAFT_545109 [Fomes fomentarius]|nr:hypothetical protein C8Q74DRAFT_545109 [Fomes fomentarius]
MASLTNGSTIHNAGLPGSGSTLESPPLDNFGALLIGSFVGLAMYGLLLNQVAIYFRSYRKDARVIKCEVVIVVSVTASLSSFLTLMPANRLLETLTTVLNIHSCYYYLVINYFDPLRLSESVWSLNLTAGILGASIFTSQSFFIRRVYLLGRSCKSIALLAGLIQLVAIAFDIAATVKAFQVDKFAEIESVTWLITGGSVAITIADAMLTVTLILALRQHRTGFRRTASMIQFMTLYTINTGPLRCYVAFAI